MRKKTIAISLIGVIVLFGIYTYLNKDNDEDLKVKDVIQTYQVKEERIEKINTTFGRVHSAEVHTLKASYESKSITWDVEVGEYVEANQILGYLDNASVIISLYEREKDVLQTEYQVNQFTDSGSEALIRSKEEAKKRLSSSRNTYEKTKVLYDSGVKSQEELDTVKLSLDIAQIAYDEASDNLNQFDYSKQLEILKKDLEIKKLQVENLEGKGSRSEILAPTSGTVSELMIETGSRVTVNADLCQIMKLDSLEVETEISEYDINDIKIDQNVIITSVSDKKINTEGYIKKIHPSADVTGSEATVKVIIGVSKTIEELKPGFTVILDIMVASKEKALVVPYDALIDTEKGQFVIIAGSDDKKNWTAVKTGIEGDFMVEVISNELKVGDKIQLLGGSMSKEGNVGEKKSFGFPPRKK